jgi:hypothetical protein
LEPGAGEELDGGGVVHLLPRHDGRPVAARVARQLAKVAEHPAGPLRGGLRRQAAQPRTRLLLPV